MATYKEELEAKLTAARARVKTGREMKALKAGAPSLFEIIDGEITLAVNRTFGEAPLSYDEYLSAHGEVKGIKRIRNLIDAKEVEEVATANEVNAIQETLKQFQDDKKSK